MSFYRVIHDGDYLGLQCSACGHKTFESHHVNARSCPECGARHSDSETHLVTGETLIGVLFGPRGLNEG
jgi:uncharacterized OB-fold protein